MKYLFYIILVIIISVSSSKNLRVGHCIENDKNTYVIPSADYCVPDYDIGGDQYYFGPCHDIECLLVEEKCRFAKGREQYCIGRDGHFCAFMDKGNFTNYYLVECG